MRLHLSSASILALATAATLLLPLNASAADFAFRKGRKVAASLDLPLESANAIPGNAIVSEPVQNNNDATAGNITSDGFVTNNGRLNQLTMNGGSAVNNQTGTIENAKINAGLLTNNGRIEAVNIAAGAGYTGNQGSSVTTLTNNGISSNNGFVETVVQGEGSLINNGTISGQATITGGTITNNSLLDTASISSGANFINNESGVARTLLNSGATTNNGAINAVIIAAGTLDNNGGATLGEVQLEAGQLQNSGNISSLAIGEDGHFANNQSGAVGRVVSHGTGSNGGTIANLDVEGGTFNNSGQITDNVDVGTDGVFSSTGSISGQLNNFGQANIAGAINSGIANNADATLNIIGNLSGGGDILNAGTFNTENARTISGFARFINTGIMNISNDLSIAGDVISTGTIRLGNQIGGDSLSVDGQLMLQSTSITTLDIAANGDHDTISATGDIELGGRLDVTAAEGDYSLTNRFAILTSTAGNIIGSFRDVIIGGVGHLFGSVEQSGEGLVLTVRNRDILDDQLATMNLGDAGQVLSGFDYSGAEGAQLFDAVSTLDETQMPSLFTQLSGAASNAIVDVGSSAARGFSNLMQKVAVASGLSRNTDGILAYEKAMAEESKTFDAVLEKQQMLNTLSFWARGFGETGESTNGGDAVTAGIGAGADVALGQSLTVGASAGYSIARSGQGTAFEGKTNSLHAGGYLAFGATAPQSTGFGLTASGAYSKHDNNANRIITTVSLTSIANANYGGTTIAGEVMVRNGFTIGDKVPLTIAPVAGVKFAIDNNEGYTETGAGALNLTVGGSNRKSLVGVIGLQLASRIETESVVFTPHVTGLYQHEFLDTATTTIRTLAGSSTPFTVKQAGGSGESYALEAGLGMRFAGGLALDVSGYSVMSPDEKRFGATATLKAEF